MISTPPMLCDTFDVSPGKDRTVSVCVEPLAPITMSCDVISSERRCELGELSCAALHLHELLLGDAERELDRGRCASLRGGGVADLLRTCGSEASISVAIGS